MNKPSKCKNCQWYGKPYWSIINPCDNCPNEEINTIITVNSNNGLAISKDNISTSTGKIVLNNVEIIDTDTFYKAVETFNELEKEIKDKDKEIARLNKIIDEIEKYLKETYNHFMYDNCEEILHNKPEEMEKYGFMYNLGSIQDKANIIEIIRKKLKELKKEGK